MLNLFTRSCASCLTLLCLSLAFLLAAPDARAGTYVGIYTDPGTLAASPYTGGNYVVAGPGGTPQSFPYKIGTTQGLAGGYGGDSGGVTASCTGAITTAWKWTHGQDQNDANDPPPAYVLVTENCSVTVTVQSAAVKGSYDTGMGQSGTVNWSQGGNNTGTATQVRYSVKTGGGSVMLPAVSASATAAASGNNSSLRYAAVISPILIAAPDPMGHPELGDGKNQEVYDSTAPSGTAPYGFLKFPGSISVVGSAAAGTAWIMRGSNNGPIVALTLDLPAETVTQGWQLYDQTILASVPASSLVVKYGPFNNLGDGFSYAGLPKLSTGFGNHLVTLTVNGSTAQQAHIQTFFTGVDANGKIIANYPSASADYTASSPDPAKRFYTPNWYYYYNQVYISPGTYDYLGQTASHIDLSSPYAIHIHDDAYNQYNLPVFDIDPKGNHYIRFIGSLAVSGIQTYLWVCAHEKGHQDLSNQIDPNGKPVCNWLNDPKGAITTDEDHLSDAWESLHHMNPTSADTTHAYGNITNGQLPGGDVADDEVTADIPAFGALMNNLTTWQSDWADPGLQWGGGKPLPFYPKPTKTQEGFFLIFTPAVAGTSATSPYQVGSTYHVHGLADLTSQYPSLLTSLP